MEKLTASETRIPPQTFNAVAFQGARVQVTRRTGESVYIVSEDDLKLLEALEDRYWGEEAEKRLREHQASGEATIPLEQVKAKLGL